jgi:hypothetical protein
MQSPSEENEEDDKSGRGEEFDEPLFSTMTTELSSGYLLPFK